MAEPVGFDHFYCKKALQYIDLQLCLDQPKQNLAHILEFSMWLTQQIPPENTDLWAYGALSEVKSDEEGQSTTKNYSYTVSRWMSLKP